MMDLVSIIVPVYNVEKYLRECLDSILFQTYKNIEIILVDDGSTDGSSTICDEYAESDTRIKVIHKKNGGLSDARNAGLELATGDFIAFCDSDDAFIPDTIGRLLALHAQYDCDVVSGESLFYSNGKTSKISHYHKTESISFYSGIEYISGFFNFSTDCAVCNKLYKKDIINTHRFEVGRTNEDILFQYDILKYCKRIVHINEGIYLYRINNTSITHTFNTNSLFTYHNAVLLHDKVEQEFPTLEEQVFYYRVLNGYTLCRKIRNNQKQNDASYRSTYNEIRKYLLKQYIRIFKSTHFSFTEKIKYAYVIAGQPLYRVISWFGHPSYHTQ